MTPDRGAATVFAVLPARLARADEPSAWASAVLGQEHVGSFLEGPCFGPDGTLFVSDLAHGRILRVSPTGEPEEHLAYGGRPNGMAALGDGALVVADYEKGLLRIDAEGRVTVLVDRFRQEPFLGLSDLVVGREGEIYFSDQGQSDLRRPVGRVFRWAPGAGLELLMDGIASPNGVALSPSADMLYVAVTRANAVYRIPLRPDGTIGKVGVHLHLSGGTGGPDGLAVDADGGLAVAHYGLGRVWFFDRRGLLTGHLDTPGEETTNVAFGGRGNRTVYVTGGSSGTIWVGVAPEPVGSTPTALQRPGC